MTDPIVSRERLAALVAQDRRRGLTIAFANGCFDLLHAGHVRYLEAAAAEADRLVVAINDDASAGAKGPGRPILPAADRAELLVDGRGEIGRKRGELAQHLRHHPVAVHAARGNRQGRETADAECEVVGDAGAAVEGDRDDGGDACQQPDRCGSRRTTRREWDGGDHGGSIGSTLRNVERARRDRRVTGTTRVYR